MTHEWVDGTFRQTNLKNESPDYLTKREALRLAEIELMQHRERVAAMRRALPPGETLADYELLEGPADLGAGDEPVRSVKLGELFTTPQRQLVVYHLMLGKKQTEACPMCTLWCDAANGVAHHLARTLDFVVVAAAEPDVLREHARRRGWNRLRLLSAGSSTFKLDLGSEDADGAQDSTVSVFTKDADGTVRHRYTAHPRMASDVKERGIDLLVPVWQYLDLTPQGRGDWYPSLSYGTDVTR